MGVSLGRIQLNLSGRHNISNALAAIAIALELNIDFSTIKTALEDIDGVKATSGNKRGYQWHSGDGRLWSPPHGNQGHPEGHPGKPTPQTAGGDFSAPPLFQNKGPF